MSRSSNPRQYNLDALTRWSDAMRNESRRLKAQQQIEYDAAMETIRQEFEKELVSAKEHEVAVSLLCNITGYSRNYVYDIIKRVKGSKWFEVATLTRIKSVEGDRYFQWLDRGEGIIQFDLTGFRKATLGLSGIMQVNEEGWTHFDLIRWLGGEPQIQGPLLRVMNLTGTSQVYPIRPILMDWLEAQTSPQNSFGQVKADPIQASERQAAQPTEVDRGSYLASLKNPTPAQQQELMELDIAATNARNAARDAEYENTPQLIQLADESNRAFTARALNAGVVLDPEDYPLEPEEDQEPLIDPDSEPKLDEYAAAEETPEAKRARFQREYPTDFEVEL